MICVNAENLNAVKNTNLMGVNVSKPFATVQGSRLDLISSWRLRAVMSTARAIRTT